MTWQYFFMLLKSFSSCFLPSSSCHFLQYLVKAFFLDLCLQGAEHRGGLAVLHQPTQGGGRVEETARGLNRLIAIASKESSTGKRSLELIRQWPNCQCWAELPQMPKNISMYRNNLALHARFTLTWTSCMYKWELHFIRKTPNVLVKIISWIITHLPIISYVRNSWIIPPRW